MVVAENPQTAKRKTQAIRNPITSEMIGEVPIATEDDVRDAVERARRAQKPWGALTVRERTLFFRRWLDLLWERQSEAMRVIREETGKSDGTAFVEVYGIDVVIQYYLHQAPNILKPKRRRSTLPGVHTAKVYYKPHGVVGVISPWNYPFLLSFIDSVPALIAGNTVVFKPSEMTPYSAEFGVNLMHEVGIPQDVAQIVHGAGQTGAALVDYVDYVCFTGSTATGRKVAQRAAERLIPYSLELGGKDPIIVLDDADLDMAATAAIRGAFENGGQFCMGIERAYVHEAIYEPFMQRIQHYAQQYTFGPEDGDHVHMGSLTNMREVERAEAHIQDAVAKGATLLSGGNRRPDLGPLFFEPTILTDVDHTMEVMREETFAPILPIMKVRNVDEALELANDSEYGLAAAVYTRDLKRGEEIAVKIDSGDVAVNAAQVVIGTPAVPSGGQKNSGVGRRNGPEGLLRYVSPQSVVINNGLGQEPALQLLDKDTKRIVDVLRLVRRHVPFI